MWATSVLWIGLLAALPTADRPGVLGRGTATMGGGIMVRFTNVAEPPLQYRGLEGGTWTAGNRLHEYIIDPASRQCFGYDLLVVPEGGNRFRVTFEPLSLTPEQIAQGRINGMIQPKFPPPQTVENGDTIAIDLLVRPDGRGKIVQYIQVSSRNDPPPPSPSLAEARDFTLDDGPLEFAFDIPTKLLINGQTSNEPGMTGKPGGTLWFNIPGRGRYILSLAPHQGFEKAGAIRDNTIIFQDGGERYELRTSGPILGAGKAWNLYMFHDASFPSRNNPQYGTDRLENLLPKK